MHLSEQFRPFIVNLEVRNFHPVLAISTILENIEEDHLEYVSPSATNELSFILANLSPIHYPTYGKAPHLRNHFFTPWPKMFLFSMTLLIL